MRMGCTQVLRARVSSMGWVPSIQPPGCLSQMLQLDVPDALPVCQPMLITCPLGWFLLCPRVMCRHFAPVCKHMYYPQMTLCSQKLLEKFLPLRPLTKGCFAWKLQWDLSWYIVWRFCGVVCWAMWDWVGLRKEYWAYPKEEYRLNWGCSFQDWVLLVVGVDIPRWYSIFWACFRTTSTTSFSWLQPYVSEGLLTWSVGYFLIPRHEGIGQGYSVPIFCLM